VHHMRWREGPTLAVLLAGTILGRSVLGQAPETRGNPDSAALVTSDIARFWRAFDGVPLDSASFRNAAPRFHRIYLDSGSIGVQDFIPHRIVSADTLAATISARWRYYAAIRQNTLALDTAATVKAAIRRSFRRLKALCADAVFPDVYFVVGAMNSGGTSSSHGLLIGVEMFARDDATPVDQLTAWERANVGHVASIPGIVAHELIHFEQPQVRGTPTLLEWAIREGGPDFVGELISGIQLNRPAHLYGDAHERALWREFSQALDSTQLNQWFYQGDRSKDRPADLGYYVGYKIAQAYYVRSTDKAAAVCTIMHSTDAHALLAHSGYDGTSATAATPAPASP
jgi:hypothetical protein